MFDKQDTDIARVSQSRDTRISNSMSVRELDTFTGLIDAVRDIETPHSTHTHTHTHTHTNAQDSNHQNLIRHTHTQTHRIRIIKIVRVVRLFRQMQSGVILFVGGGVGST